MTDTESEDLPAVAYYLPRGQDEFESTAATTSPWDGRMQHGGPPAGLLARAVEQVRPDSEMPIARITIDMLGPIPQGRIVTSAEIVRPGKRVEMITAKLWANDTLAVTATAWRLRHTPGSTQDQAHAVALPSVPGPQEQRFFPGVSPNWGYGRSIDWRWVQGSIAELGPAEVWARVRIPLVEGEAASPIQRLATIADSANGISGELPQAQWLFVPTTMTLTLARPPRGEWINIAARTMIADSGTGVAFGDVHDPEGFVGTVSQPLVISRR